MPDRFHLVGEGAPSPLDKMLPSGSSYCFTFACRHYCLRRHALPPAPACITACTCSTHILFDLSFTMSGSGGYFVSAAPAPAMSKVLRLIILFDLSSSEVSGLLSVAKETPVFIPKNCDVIKPLFRSMMSSFCILIGCQGTAMPPSGDFLIFPALFQCVKVRCLPDSSEIGRFFTSWASLNMNASA